MYIRLDQLAAGKDGQTHGAPYRGYGYVPLRFGGNVVRRMGTQQQQLLGKVAESLA